VSRVFHVQLGRWSVALAGIHVAGITAVVVPIVTHAAKSSNTVAGPRAHARKMVIVHQGVEVKGCAIGVDSAAIGLRGQIVKAEPKGTSAGPVTQETAPSSGIVKTGQMCATRHTEGLCSWPVVGSTLPVIPHGADLGPARGRAR
jgi:hypothetical protein